MPNKEPASSSAKTEDGEAQTEVRKAADQIRSSAVMRVGSARDAADSARARAAERVRKLGGAVKKIGEHMRIEEQDYIADRATLASQSLDSVADYIANRDLADVIQDAGDVARKQPALVLGGTFLLGLAAGRLLKETARVATESEAKLQTKPQTQTQAHSQRSRSATQVRQ